KIIIYDGVNGLLAKSDDDWFEKISTLIEDKEMREKIGKEGRNTVEREYSIESNQEKYLRIIQEVQQ
ncbi:MAG: glycosyltransferase, partial [Nitrospinae bacterium]|nr:glycosyltransferase [Nitrospinota bacterium]